MAIRFILTEYVNQFIAHAVYDNEFPLSYFRRIIGYLDGKRRGFIFLLEPANLRIGEVEHAVSLWREIQNEELG